MTYGSLGDSRHGKNSACVCGGAEGHARRGTGGSGLAQHRRRTRVRARVRRRCQLRLVPGAGRCRRHRYHLHRHAASDACRERADGAARRQGRAVRESVHDEPARGRRSRGAGAREEAVPDGGDVDAFHARAGRGAAHHRFGRDRPGAPGHAPISASPQRRGRSIACSIRNWAAARCSTSGSIRCRSRRRCSGRWNRCRRRRKWARPASISRPDSRSCTQAAACRSAAARCAHARRAN